MKTEDLFSNKDECCGCSMCANQCPRNAILMIPDSIGFLYPQINQELCIDCGKCLNACPIKDSTLVDSQFISFYGGSFKEDKDTITCASGGIATAISRAFITKGGVVFGASYTEDYKGISYIRAEDKQDVEKLKTSKYVQAEKGVAYQQAETDLKNGKQVLFIGLPCDVAAIEHSLGKYSGLYTIELICHGPTSQSVHQQYLAEIEKRNNSAIKEFSTRWKKDGEWIPFYIRAKLCSGQELLIPFHESSYGAAFRYLKRPACYSCKIKGSALAGDLMIGDYHYIDEGMKGYNKHGVSSALVHNNKGQELIDMIGSEFSVIEISEKGAKANIAIFKPILKPKGQKQFEEIFERKGLIAANELWIVRKSNLKRKTKAFVLRFGVKVKRLLVSSSKTGEHN